MLSAPFIFNGPLMICSHNFSLGLPGSSFLCVGMGTTCRQEWLINWHGWSPLTSWFLLLDDGWLFLMCVFSSERLFSLEERASDRV